MFIDKCHKNNNKFPLILLVILILLVHIKIEIYFNENVYFIKRVSLQVN